MLWLLGLPLGNPAWPDVAELCADVTAAYLGKLTGSAPATAPQAATKIEGQLRFWRQTLAGAPAVLNLPADRLRPPSATFRARTLTVALPALSANAEPRPDEFDRLLAALAVLLYRLTGDGDIVLGARWPSGDGAASTPRPVPVRVRLSGDQQFDALRYQVGQARAAAARNGAVRLDRIAAQAGTATWASYHPVFQVLAEHRLAITGALNLPGTDVAMLPAPRAGWSPYDLHVSVGPAGTGQAGLSYSVDLFDEPTAGHLAEALRSVVLAAADEPRTAVRDLALLSQACHREVVGLNRTGTVQVRPVTLATAAGSAEVAVVEAGSGLRMSYPDLAARAGRLAGQLQASGVRPGSVVGLLLPRSAAAIAAVFAVLHLRAAYLPLDADHPAGRLRQAIAEAGPDAVITNGRLAASLQPIDVPLIRGDADDGAWAAAGAAAPAVPGTAASPVPDAASPPAPNPASPPAPNPASPPAPADQHEVAYVMYTSGSTGRPRAVQVLHRGLAAYVQAAISRYQLGSSDRVLQFSSLGFDVSAEEIFPCLSVGATLVLRSATMLASPRDFLAELAEYGVTVMHLPASYFHELAAHLPVSPLRPPPSLRLVVVGGEPVVAAHARAWLDWTGPRVRLVNVYGITETTIVTTIADLSAASLPGTGLPGTGLAGTGLAGTGLADTDLPGRVPIGRPIEGSDVYVLDDQLRPVPPGFPGEICIAGAGLARGYLRRPGATAERFVPHPFATGERLYRSGDVGRMRADGTLECIGRMDRQVKLHGYRIELGEVEAALCRVREVDEAAVTVRPDRLGRDCLVGHVTIAPAGSISPDQLRAEVAATLPHYMVPHAIVLLDTMPHSAHDKIDYRALPDPGVPSDSPEPVTDPTEIVVAQAWQQVLDLAAIGSQDNFFELGGHSLSAMQVTTKLREVFGPDLAVTVLFEHPRLSDFAAAAASASAGTAP